MSVPLSQRYQDPNTLTLWSTAGQFHTAGGRRKRNVALSAAESHSEETWENAAARRQESQKLIWPGAEQGEGSFSSSNPPCSPDGVGEGQGVIVTVYPVLQTAH